MGNLKGRAPVLLSMPELAPETAHDAEADCERIASVVAAIVAHFIMCVLCECFGIGFGGEAFEVGRLLQEGPDFARMNE